MKCSSQKNPLKSIQKYTKVHYLALDFNIIKWQTINDYSTNKYPIMNKTTIVSNQDHKVYTHLRL